MPPSPRRARPLATPRVGLVAQAAQVTEDPEVRWGLGVEWQAELHVHTGAGYGARALRCEPSTVIDLTAAEKAPLVEAYPFMVYALDWCTTLGYEGRDFEGRARRLLEATQGISIAAEFWAGALSTAETLDNVWLAKAGAVEVGGGTAQDPVDAVGLLDAEIALRLANGRGMLHMDPAVLARLVAADVLYRDGDRWLTPMGNIAVADGGYTGARDGETGRWIVATTMVEIVLGPIRAMRLTAPDEWVAALDIGINKVAVWAQRDVLVMHEPGLLHAAAQIDMT